MCVYFFPKLLTHRFEWSFFPSLPLVLAQSPFPQAWDALGRWNLHPPPPTRGSSSRHAFTYARKQPFLVANPHLLPGYWPTPRPKAAARRPQPSGGQTGSTDWWRPGGLNRRPPPSPAAALRAPRFLSSPSPRTGPSLEPLLPQKPGQAPSPGHEGKRQRRGRRLVALTSRRVTSSWQKSLLGAGACPHISNTSSSSSDAILGRWKAVSMATRKRRTSRGVTGSPAPS